MKRHELIHMADALAAFFYYEGNFMAWKFFAGMAYELRRTTDDDLIPAVQGITDALELGRNRLGPCGLA